MNENDKIMMREYVSKMNDVEAREIARLLIVAMLGTEDLRIIRDQETGKVRIYWPGNGEDIVE
jgi:hypothetical protein